MADNKMTLQQIRDMLLRLNNPEVPVEDRQRALTSLNIELIDRVTELHGATVAAVKRMTTQVEELAGPVADLVAHFQAVQQVAGTPPEAPAAPPPAPPAKAEGNGKKKATVAAVPPAPVEAPIAPPTAPPVATGQPALATVQTKVIQG